jgi:hypothetical protein
MNKCLLLLLLLWVVTEVYGRQFDCFQRLRLLPELAMMAAMRTKMLMVLR